MQKTVSIIIPVYNTAAYLPRCLDSIFNQVDAPPFEIIAVDDGSSDDSLSILRSYAAKHENMQVLSAEHQGVSHARNLGLERVQAEYVAFIDSDDFVLPDYLKTLTATVQGCDFALVNWFNYYNDSQTFSDAFQQDSLPNYQGIIEGLTLERHHKVEIGTLTVWAKLYRAELINPPLAGREAVRFPETIVYGEDAIFNMRFLKRASTLAMRNDSGYVRCLRSDSATTQANIVLSDTILNYFNAARKELIEVHNTLAIKRMAGYVTDSVVRNYYKAVCMSNLPYSEKRAKAISCIKRCEFLRYFTVNSKAKLIGKVCTRVGLFFPFYLEAHLRPPRDNIYYSSNAKSQCELNA